MHGHRSSRFCRYLGPSCAPGDHARPRPCLTDRPACFALFAVLPSEAALHRRAGQPGNGIARDKNVHVLTCLLPFCANACVSIACTQHSTAVLLLCLAPCALCLVPCALCASPAIPALPPARGAASPQDQKPAWHNRSPGRTQPPPSHRSTAGPASACHVAWRSGDTRQPSTFPSSAAARKALPHRSRSPPDLPPSSARLTAFLS